MFRLKVFVSFLAMSFVPLMAPDHNFEQAQETVTQATPEKRGGEVEFIKLSGPNGSPIWFNRGEIIAFQGASKEHSAKHVRSQIRVHDGSLWVRESTAEIVETLGDVSAFVQFTTPDRAPIWISRAEIIAFHEPVKGITSPEARTQIKVHDGSYFVRESLSEVVGKLVQ